MFVVGVIFSVKNLDELLKNHVELQLEKKSLKLKIFRISFGQKLLSMYTTDFENLSGESVTNLNEPQSSDRNQRNDLRTRRLKNDLKSIKKSSTSKKRSHQSDSSLNSIAGTPIVVPRSDRNKFHISNLDFRSKQTQDDIKEEDDCINDKNNTKRSSNNESIKNANKNHNNSKFIDKNRKNLTSIIIEEFQREIQTWENVSIELEKKFSSSSK